MGLPSIETRAKTRRTGGERVSKVFAALAEAGHGQRKK